MYICYMNVSTHIYICVYVYAQTYMFLVRAGKCWKHPGVGNTLVSDAGSPRSDSTSLGGLRIIDISPLPIVGCVPHDANSVGHCRSQNRSGSVIP